MLMAWWLWWQRAGFNPFPLQQRGFASSVPRQNEPCCYGARAVAEMNRFLFLTDCENCLCPRASETEISIAQGNTASKHIHFSFLAAGVRKACCVRRSLSSQLVHSLMSLLLARAWTEPGCLRGAQPHQKTSRHLINSAQALKASLTRPSCTGSGFTAL